MNTILTIEPKENHQQKIVCEVNYSEKRETDKNSCEYCRENGDTITPVAIEVTNVIHSAWLSKDGIRKQLKEQLEKIYSGRCVCTKTDCKREFDRYTHTLTSRNHSSALATS